MSDPLERPGDRMFTAAAEYGRTYWGWDDDEPDTDPESLIDSLHEWQAEQGTTDATMLTVVLEAQTKATLYLAEQQRIANMIAFGQATGESYRTEIRKALGISHE